MSVSQSASSDSPFHAGELAVQSRLGVQAQADRQGRRMIRSYLVDQHRQFFSQLSYVVVGSVDASGRPWASLLLGAPGFLSTPDQHTLRVVADPLPGDPLRHTLAVHSDIGFLGIELSTRRRNRINGTVSSIDQVGFEVKVKQSFGNCPQYIQSRSIQAPGSPESAVNLTQKSVASPEVVREISSLSTVEKTLISEADTFFIATAFDADKHALNSGVDISHRGGKPGFVRIDGDNTLTIPDFSGNHHFNTLGNIELNPRAGLLFISFDCGDLLYLTGSAEVIWDGPDVVAYPGAERLLRFRIEHGYRVERGLPIRWSAPEFSPYLEKTGHWSCGG